MPKTGRNDLCHCGSGRKYKKCHGARESSAARGRMMLFIVGGAVAAAILVGIASFTGQRASGPTRVWSTEHNHYHDANGVEIP
jgi:SEC-C motif